METPAFVRIGWLHRPAGAAGWIVTLAAITYMSHVFFAIGARAHSVSDALYAVYPHWGVTFLGWDWVARRASGADNR